ncbi:MAG: ABC transporter permease [Chloroflexi bacterium]|jgi:lipopolysaccharide transport system permease protein|nr:ABC transporter permease [Chloroflexota bacterium]
MPEGAVERTVIDADGKMPLIDWRELRQYRDLFYFLVWRDIKTRYAQSVLGVGWAVIQPVFSMIVFTIVFGRLAQVDSDGVPYAIFSFTALVPWTYFSGALTGASGSLTSASNMITKVYFPRLVIPFAPVLGKLVDFAIAMLLLFGMMAWFRILPTAGVLFLPALILLMMATSAGMGMWLTALSVQYRDINYAMGFLVQLLMYAAPVVYPASAVPEQFRLLYSLFPMAGVIEGFRSALLGTNPMPWDMIGVGAVSALIIFISGAAYFRRMERIFADVV